MKKIEFLGIFLLGLGILSCNNEPTIQEYYVENQEDNKFVAIDVPTSLLANNEELNEKQQATLNTVKKVNVLAYPLEEGAEDYEEEKLELQEILKNEKYQLLMKYGSGDRKAEIYFTGDENAIDEFILFGFDNSRGMGLARILGEDMKPDDLLELFRSLEKGDINLEGLKGIAEMFKGNSEIKIEEKKSSE